MAEGMDEYITKPIETSELLYILNKFLSDKAIDPSKSTEKAKPEKKVLKETEKPKETEKIKLPEDDQEDDMVDLVLDLATEKKILIAKKFLIERRVLEKVLGNLNYPFTSLNNVDELNDTLKTDTYDIVFADKDLVSDDISHSYDNLAIITSSNSKDEIESLVKKHRG